MIRGVGLNGREHPRLLHSRGFHRHAIHFVIPAPAAVLALPGHARLAAACTARTVDAIWHAAGDRAADFSWYTKRAVLAAVYGATVLFWLRDSSDDDALTLAFLDRRLADVGQIGRLRRRAVETLKRLRPPFRRPA